MFYKKYGKKTICKQKHKKTNKKYIKNEKNSI